MSTHNGTETLQMADSCFAFGVSCSLEELKRSVDAACTRFFISRGMTVLDYGSYFGRGAVAVEVREQQSRNRQRAYLRRVGLLGHSREAAA